MTGPLRYLPSCLPRDGGAQQEPDGERDEVHVRPRHRIGSDTLGGAGSSGRLRSHSAQRPRGGAVQRTNGLPDYGSSDGLFEESRDR